MAQKPIRQEKWAGQKDMGCGGSQSAARTDSWAGGHGWAQDLEVGGGWEEVYRQRLVHSPKACASQLVSRMQMVSPNKGDSFWT